MGRREAFDPLRKYVANRAFTFGSTKYKVDDPFNDRKDMRRMRQLYDNRWLRMAPADDSTPDFKTMTEDQLKEWLIAAGSPSLAHPRSKHFRLVERCQRIWAEMAAKGLTVAAKPAAPAPRVRRAAPPRVRLPVAPKVSEAVRNRVRL